MVPLHKSDTWFCDTIAASEPSGKCRFELWSRETGNHWFLSRVLKNVFEAGDARQKQAKKRNLFGINEHFEPVFNAAAATQIVFQHLARETFTNDNANATAFSGRGEPR